MMISYWTTDLKNVWSNQDFQSFFKKNADEIMGVHLEKIVGETLFQQNLPFLEKVLLGEPQTFQRIATSPMTKSSRTTVVNYCPDIENGKVKGVFIVGSDITEQLETQRKLESIVRNSPGMIYQFKMDPSGKFTFPFYSEKAYEIYETSQVTLDSNPELMLNMVHEDDQLSMIEAIKESAKSLTPFVWTGKIRTSKGNIKHVEAKGIPLKLEDGSTLWNGITVDVTDKIHLQFEIESERQKVFHQSKLASVGEMAAGIAHEVNNPLTIISGNLVLIHRKMESVLAQDPALEALFGKVTSNVKRISAIIKSLKSISRKETDLSEPVKTPISELVSSVVTLSTEKMKLKSISFQADLINQDVVCVPSQVEQVLFNLVNNSIYALESVNDKWIKIATKEYGNFIQFSVSDSGSGISKANQEKLMQPFFTTKPAGEGTGLGLSIGRKIIEAHGGQFFYDNSSPNTSFVFTLPKTLGVLIENLNVEQAIQAHVDWKKNAIENFDINSAKYDLATVENCEICYLGQWISLTNHMLNQNPLFQSLKKSHKEFHKCAGRFVTAKKENRDTLELARDLEILTYEIVSDLKELKKI